MHHPVQMKPADSDQKNEDRKLFVGMISKKMSDEEVKGLFVPFGSIEECRVLRTTDGQSRGCAFVTFNNKNQATNAIRGLHQSRTLEVSFDRENRQKSPEKTKNYQNRPKITKTDQNHQNCQTSYFNHTHFFVFSFSGMFRTGRGQVRGYTKR